VGIDSVAMDADGTDTVVIRNNIPNSITVTGLWINTTTERRDESANIIKNASFENDADGITLASGETATLSTGNIITCTAGETVTFYMKVEYTDLDTSAIYNYSAQNNAYETTCAT
jgi:hypothetical protein